MKHTIAIPYLLDNFVNPKLAEIAKEGKQANEIFDYETVTCCLDKQFILQQLVAFLKEYSEAE